MGQPYCTTAQVLDRSLSKIVAQAGWNLTDPGQFAIQDITYTLKATGFLTVAYVPGGTAGSEAVAVAASAGGGNAITVTIQSGVSTATQVLTAISGSPAAVALVVAAITGTAGTAQVSTGAPIIITGSVAQRISEGDREIDTKLAGLEVTLPFTSNPPAITDISVARARYACFRDLYAAGDPKVQNPNAKYYKDLFEEKWMDLKEGWSKLVDSSGARVAMTKFATITTGFPCPQPQGDRYPNFPSGPYQDPPGIGD